MDGGPAVALIIRVKDHIEVDAAGRVLSSIVRHASGGDPEDRHYEAEPIEMGAMMTMAKGPVGTADGEWAEG